MRHLNVVLSILYAFCLEISAESQCPSGFFTGKDSQCTVCPMNAQCDGRGFACHAGFGISDDGQWCMKCSYGKVKSGAGNFPCVNCPAGSEPAGNQEYCNVCSTNTYKPTDDFMFCLPCPANAKCRADSYVCAKGYHRPSAGQDCTLCPRGTFKTEPGDTGCSPCSKNTLSVANRTMCTICSTGSFYSDQEEDCIRCPVGTESTLNNTSCSLCSVGYYRPQLEDDKCSPCPKGASCTVTSFVCGQGYYLAPSGKGCTMTPPQVASRSTGNTDISFPTALGMIVSFIIIVAVGSWLYRRWRDKHDDPHPNMRTTPSQLTPTVPMHNDVISPNSAVGRKRFTFERVNSDDHFAVNKV